jgi:hypothetical protein
MTKGETFDFESGSLNMTTQLIELGFLPVVVDGLGATWCAEDWPQSQTFRSGLQNNLLVADNWTDKFDLLRPKARKRLVNATWGDAGIFAARSELRRLYLQMAHGFLA